MEENFDVTSFLDVSFNEGLEALQMMQENGIKSIVFNRKHSYRGEEEMIS